MRKNNSKQTKTLKGCTPYLFTMRQEGQSFDMELLGQKQLID